LKHLAVDIAVPFDYTNGLLFIAIILFGFSSLIVVNKEWVDKRIWTILLPPLALIVLSGMSISNLALGYTNSVQAVVFSLSAFNANVVNIGFILGYVTQKLPARKSLEIP
jgi:hypothetical protein